jgi:serine/threonine protein kinase
VVAVPNVDTPREISYKEIVAITNDFSESQVVAELDFGTGYEGYLDPGHGGGRIHVLVKRLGMKTCPALRVRFTNELCNLAKLRHRNLVQLRGWCTDHGEMLVVYDHSPGNLLSHHLLARQSDREILSWRHRYGIVRALASAVLYLHEEWDELVIHRNITSAAVFLDPDRSPRLGSFALAEFLSRNEHGGHHVVVPTGSGSARGIFGYMSPEYMETGEASTMADVYSFGVVVLEVVTGAMAVDVRSPEVLLVRKVQLCQEQDDRDNVEALADRRLDDRFDPRELVRLAKLGIACTRSDPAARPSMRNVVSILDGNDEVLSKFERRAESREEWETKNAAALSLVRRLQALGIH